MKQIICTFCIAFLAFPSVILAQSARSQLKSLSSDGDPFRIGSGTTFSASAPSGNKAATENKSISERKRILDEIREARAVILTNYAGSAVPATEELTSSALTSMLHVLDPHSNFYGRNQWNELLNEQQSGYAGIGTSLASYSDRGRDNTYIVSTFDGTPARRAEFKFGDRIVAVNGVNLEGQPIEYVRDKIRGPIGASVRITVERAASGRMETVELRREIVPQPSIPDSYLIRPGVGYIDLSEGFNYTTDTEFGTALRRLKEQGMNSLVLDLRGNGGGIVDQAVKVAERFLPNGTLIVSQRGRTSADYREWVSTNRVPETMPLVLLVDENTASASEIVAGALQDCDRALIVGEKTFGKGLVQSVIDLPFKTGLTLTAARYYTPSGRSIQRDYSHISRYEYYSHITPAAAIGTPYFETRTVTDRRVHGGDGITPDDVVPAKEMTAVQARLLDPIFFFARDLVTGRIAGFDAAAFGTKLLGKQEIPVDFAESDPTLITFSDYVKKANTWKFDDRQLKADATFVKRRLRYYISMATSGATTANQVLVRDDPQIAKAVESLNRAAQLARLAAKVRQKRK